MLTHPARRNRPVHILPQSPDDTEDTGPCSSSNLGQYAPKPNDVYRVRALLKSLKLPTEIVLTIMDYAPYSAVVRSHRGKNIQYDASSNIHNVHAGLYLASPPIPYPDKEKGEHYRPKHVKFHLRSCDQGWGGEAGCKGTYNGSWTWFEASILRRITSDVCQEPLEIAFSKQHVSESLIRPIEAQDRLRALGWDFVPAEDDHVVWHLQSNLTATSTLTDHEVEWRLRQPQDMGGEDGKGDGYGFVEKLMPGDVVVLWARAQFPGWCNKVRAASVEVAFDV